MVSILPSRIEIETLPYRWLVSASIKGKPIISLIGPLFANIDDSLLLYNDVINKTFVARWGSHKCAKQGCGNVLVFDGGVKVWNILNKEKILYLFNFYKANRKICAAIRSEVKIYQPSGIHVNTGAERFVK